MAHKAGDGGNGVIIIVQELKGKILPGTLLDTLDSHRSLAPSGDIAPLFVIRTDDLQGVKCLHKQGQTDVFRQLLDLLLHASRSTPCCFLQ
jgi:hypothetical protein